MRLTLQEVYNSRDTYSTDATKESQKNMVEMTVESVRINLATQQRVVILKATKQERYLFIWIAQAEAYAIAVELQGTSSPRPLTHDLLKNVIGELGANMESIVISDLIDEIFYARLVLDIAGRHVEVDSRPSDAIALAVRAKTPIFVEESVLERAGVALESNDEPQKPLARSEQKRGEVSKEEEANLDAYRDFINTLDVLDEFGKD
ncbi:MAG: bifunctional nuclease family protein [Ktedonobacteraceae bacterium]